MTKAKRVLSIEEHEKAKEERARPFRLEIADVGNETFSIKSPILLSKEQYNLIKKVCDITDERLEQYIKDALIQSIEIDLSDPTIFGQTVCEVLRKQWDPIKPK